MRRRIIPYDPKLKQLARNLRNNSTLAEVLLWRELKGKQVCGYDFHRQKPIDKYIVDFYCPDLLLAIEIDGTSHDDQIERDDVRQRTLESLGVRFLRFTDKEVKTNLHGVVMTIEDWIEAHALTPNPSKGGEYVIMNYTLIPSEMIEKRIYLIGGQKVMLDFHLAELYSVPIKRLNEQGKRNLKRFPTDFMFQLSQEEYISIRSQFATLKTGRGRHRKYLPYAFTEQSVAMLSSVLNSEKAIHSQNSDFWHRKYLDRSRSSILMEAIRQLMTPPGKNNGKLVLL